jgi:hypothetical protein
MGLNDIGVGLRKLLPKFVEAAKDWTPYVRQYALMSLGALGPRGMA